VAINQASFFLFPPRYGPSIELDHSVKTATGEPMRLVDSILVEPDANRVQTSALRKWFETRGFTELERFGGCCVMFRGKEVTFLGVQEEIVFSIPLDEDEICELCIRFLLTEKTPTQWDAWEALIISLGDDFGFKLLGPDDYLTPCVDFFSLLTNNYNFKWLQGHHQWNVDRMS
jgi:hypothetical protein